MNDMAASVTRGIRDYVRRDWEVARAAKDDYWSARIRRLGPREGLRIADELRRQVLALDVEWPSQADREGDLATHARVSELLRRAEHARRR
jgi:hypothetical protein